MILRSSAQVCQVWVSVPPLGTRGEIISNLEPRFRYIYPHIPMLKQNISISYCIFLLNCCVSYRGGVVFQYLFPLQLSEEACARNMLQSSIKHSITSVSLQGAAQCYTAQMRGWIQIQRWLITGQCLQCRFVFPSTQHCTGHWNYKALLLSADGHISSGENK